MIIEQPAPHAYSEASSDCLLSCMWEQGWVHGCGRDVSVGDAGEGGGGQCWRQPMELCPGLELGALVMHLCCSARTVVVV